jgi:tRNA-specific 2-thiouridylase
LDGKEMNSLGINKRPEDTRVVVAMSGGVDSSVVAGLMAQEGYETIGVTLQLYDHGAAIHRKGACCAGQDIHDARRVAAALNIPHYVLDYESRFRDAVIEDFADSYVRGETPIPCVKCNQTVKFEDLLRVSKDLDADVLVTGHYIQSLEKDGQRGMFRPNDHGRDQSYFLFATTQEQLDFLRFPLGGMTKDAVRDIARDMGLVVAEKSDSQDICFVPNGNYAQIITKLRPEASEGGEIVHMDGRVLGEHKGIIHYTIGQRRGLGISAPEPLYVVKLEPETRRVIVGPYDALATRAVRLKQVNWLGAQSLAEIEANGPIDIEAKVRSTRPPQPARLNVVDGVVEVELLGGEHGVSPGQACVFYADNDPNTQVLGGGWIAEAVSAKAA